MSETDSHFAFLTEGIELAVSLSNDLMSLKKDAGVDSIVELVNTRIAQLNIFESFAVYLLEDQLSFELSSCVPDTARDEIGQDVQAHIENGTFSWVLNSSRPLAITGPVSHKNQLLYSLATRRCVHGMFVGTAQHGKSVEGYMLSIIHMILSIAVHSIDNALLTHELMEQNLTLEEQIKLRTQEYKEAKLQAEEASRSKSDFLANMSHDIRTPMNGVLGMLELLRTTPLEIMQTEYVDTAFRSGEHLLSLLNDILDLSKVESGQLDVEFVDFNLLKQIDDLMDLLSVKAAERGNHLYACIDPDVPEVVRTDKTRLWQILVNLLGNAIKFTDSGDIHIRVSCVPSNDTHLMLRFEIQDNGIGIRSESLDMVFDPFQQAEKSTTREFGGTGLGLALCKRLSESMGGGIGVESEPGNGSTFWVTVMAERSCEHDALSINHEQETKNVLVVSEPGSFADSIAKYLARLNVKHVQVTDVESANNVLSPPSGGGDEIDVVILSNGNNIHSITTEHQHCDVWCVAGEDVLPDGVHALRSPVTYHEVLNLVFGHVRETGKEEEVFAQFKGHVLVVEDNKVNQMVMRGMLEHLGVDIIIANNGHEALEILESHLFDLVLMDIQMPGIDGLETTRRLRKMQAGVVHTLVVAVTANVMKEDIAMCHEVGMDDVVSKPVSLKSLHDLFSKYLVSSSENTSIPSETVTPKLEEHIDMKVTEQLKYLMEDDFAGTIKMFLNQSAVQLEQLFESMDIDKNECALEVHSLKGSAANIGARRLAVLAEKIEKSLKNDEGEKVRKLINDAKDELEVITPIFTKMITMTS